jgi:hypothetical protein
VLILVYFMCRLQKRSVIYNFLWKTTFVISLKNVELRKPYTYSDLSFLPDLSSLYPSDILIVSSRVMWREVVKVCFNTSHDFPEIIGKKHKKM